MTQSNLLTGIGCVVQSWLTIAKWELMRSKLKFSAGSVALLIIALIFVFTVSYAASQTGMSMNQKIYLIAFSQQEVRDEVRPVIAIDPRFDYMMLDRRESLVYHDYGADMSIIGDNIYLGDTQKAASAGDALESTFKTYREIVLTSYNDVNNTHPVWVKVHELERPQDFQLAGGEEVLDDIASDSDRNVLPEDIPDDVIESTGNVRTGSSTLSPEDIEALDRVDTTFYDTQTVSTPSNFSPSIPFTAILYAFMFLFPIYFVSQFYSTSLMDERTNRKGELLLIAPLKARDIVIGKTIPYLFITMVIQTAVTLYIMGIPSTVRDIEQIILVLAAILPVILLFFALSFYSAILSRSFKELTFASVFLSVIISGYLFFPAMFANIHAISSISPITLVVRLIEGESVLLNTYLFSALPFYLVALAVYASGISIFREEDLFTQRTVGAKIIDCFEMFLSHRFGSIFFLSIIFIPVVYMTQLMLIVMLFNLPLPYSVLAMILLSALAEEIVKSIGIYTLFKRNITPLTFKNAILLSILSGAGFFVGEKALAVLTLAPIATSAFGTVMTMGALLLIPLVLHVTTVMISSLIMYRRGPGAYKYAVVLAAIFHSAYNLFILRGLLF